jgi:hypothetical protein
VLLLIIKYYQFLKGETKMNITEDKSIFQDILEFTDLDTDITYRAQNCGRTNKGVSIQLYIEDQGSYIYECSFFANKFNTKSVFEEYLNCDEC